MEKKIGKKHKKFSFLQAVRLLLQVVFFVFLPSLYIGAFNGIKSLYQAFIHLSLGADILPDLIPVIAVVPATVLFGRFFCGWMCAFGSVGDFLYLAVHKIFPRKIKIRETVDRWLKYLKYAVLAVLAVAVWTFGSSAFAGTSPWDAFGMLATVGSAPDFSVLFSQLAAGFAILIAALAASTLIERFFCRYLCPLGAIFSILSIPRIARIRKPSAKCGNCKACSAGCPMEIPLYKMESVYSGECIHCMKCITACPRGNAEFSVSGKDVRPLLASVASVAIMTGTYYSADIAVSAQALGSGGLASQSEISSSSSYGPAVSSSPSSETVSNATSPSSEAASPAASSSAASSSEVSSAASSGVSGIYADGTYEGSGRGFRGTITVSVVVSGGKITSVDVVSYRDDRPYFKRAYSRISDDVISSQSADVDAVSGATYSSRGLINAVADALSKASS